MGVHGCPRPASSLGAARVLNDEEESADRTSESWVSPPKVFRLHWHEHGGGVGADFLLFQSCSRKNAFNNYWEDFPRLLTSETNYVLRAVRQSGTLT